MKMFSDNYPKNFYTQREWDRVVGWGTVPVEYDINLDKTWVADAPSDYYSINITPTYNIISVTVTYNKKEVKYDVHS